MKSTYDRIITIELVPSLNNEKDLNVSKILSELASITKSEGFNDVLVNGRRVFQSVMKPMEEDCKMRNIPPLVFTVALTEEIASSIDSISQHSHLSNANVAKVVLYRSYELKQMKGREGTQNEREKRKFNSNTNNINKNQTSNEHGTERANINSRHNNNDRNQYQWHQKQANNHISNANNFKANANANNANANATANNANNANFNTNNNANANNVNATANKANVNNFNTNNNNVKANANNNNSDVYANASANVSNNNRAKHSNNYTNNTNSNYANNTILNHKTESKEEVKEVLNGWGLPVEKKMETKDSKSYTSSKNKRMDHQEECDEWGIPLNPKPDPVAKPIIKRVMGLDGMMTRDEEEERELFSKSELSGINFKAYNDIPVTLTGKDIPKCIKKFSEAKLRPSIINALSLSKYDSPSPIQQHAIPIILSGRDVKASAQTGSGKTAAFLIPLIHEIIVHLETTDDKDKDEVCPYALILSPTRELCIQTYEEALKFSYRSKVRTQILYGGGGNKDVEKCEILVATPGRLIEFVLKRRTVNFSRLKYFVLDEADRMLDLGFHPQIRQLEVRMPERDERQTLLFSATFPPAIETLVEDFLKQDQVGIAVGRVGSTSNTITQSLFFFRDNNEKADAITRLINQVPGPTVIFVNMKVVCNILLQKIKQEANATVTTIHGDLEQYQREEALDKFREGKARVLIATDVFSRGIDISSIKHVINYDMPGSIDDYVHRIGRTGRAGNEGRSTAFLTAENSRVAPELLEVLVESKQEVPNWLHQLVSRENSYREKAKERREADQDYYDDDPLDPMPTNRRRNGRGGYQKFSHGERSFDNEGESGRKFRGGR